MQQALEATASAEKERQVALAAREADELAKAIAASLQTSSDAHAPASALEPSGPSGEASPTTLGTLPATAGAVMKGGPTVTFASSATATSTITAAPTSTAAPTITAASTITARAPSTAAVLAAGFSTITTISPVPTAFPPGTYLEPQVVLWGAWGQHLKLAQGIAQASPAAAPSPQLASAPPAQPSGPPAASAAPPSAPTASAAAFTPNANAATFHPVQLAVQSAPAEHGAPTHFNAQNERLNSHGKPYMKPPPPGQRGCNGGSRAACRKREKEKEKRQLKSAAKRL